MTELELLNRAQDNDQQAFKKIFVKYEPVIFYMIYQMVPNCVIAEDLTIETFEKAFRDIKKFVPNYKLLSWISKIGKNHTLDYIRAQNSRPKFVELDYMLQDHWSPEKQLIAKEEVSIIEKIVDDLNGTYKDIVKLRIEGNSYKEISEKLNIPIGTVEGYIHVSRKRILKKRDEFDKIKHIPNIKKDLLDIKRIRLRKYREANKEKLAEYQKKYRLMKRTNTNT
jgi:RNA polymerase sigma-70 factor (ECF subfamily)